MTISARVDDASTRVDLQWQSAREPENRERLIGRKCSLSNGHGRTLGIHRTVKLHHR
jgi:hypothetical protein